MEENLMFKLLNCQKSFFDAPEMFGGVALDPNNYWVKMSKMIPWAEFDEEYSKNFSSNRGQVAFSSRMALASIFIKIHYGNISDEGVCDLIVISPYLQYFIGLQEFVYECPFVSSTMSRFRQRITPETFAWVNDLVIAGLEANKDSNNANTQEKTDAEASFTNTIARQALDENSDKYDNIQEASPTHKGILTLDATCVPQNIAYPTDVSLLNEARQITEEVIDELHKNGFSAGKKPRTYRDRAKKEFNKFSKNKKKTAGKVRKAVRAQLLYITRNLGHINKYVERHEKCMQTLKTKLLERLGTAQKLYEQQLYMYNNNTRRVDNRIVSISQPWIRPIVRGKLKNDVEFGAKVEMSLVDGYLRVERLDFNAFNEATNLPEAIESYREKYGYYPEKVLVDKIYRNKKNIQYCKERGIHINGPKLGKPYADPIINKQQKLLEYQESIQRADIEREFGVAKTRFGLDLLTTKLKHTSEVMIHATVLYMNLRKKLRLLFCLFFRCLKSSKKIFKSILSYPQFVNFLKMRFVQ